MKTYQSRWLLFFPLVAVAASQVLAAPALPQVELQSVRWQHLPMNIESVKIDTQGKAWFRASGAPSVAEVKRLVEKAATAEVPVIAGAQIIHFDRQNRIWLLPSRNTTLLLSYDLRKKVWREYPAEKSGNRTYGFRSVWGNFAWESSAGVLYFSSSMGAYVLDKDDWSHQHFYEANAREPVVGHTGTHAFNPAVFVEDKAGNVYAWSSWGGTYNMWGTLGYFVHADGKWKQVRTLHGKTFDKIQCLAPVGKALLLFTQDGHFNLVHPSQPKIELNKKITQAIQELADERFPIREAAQSRLYKMGGGILSLLIKAREKSEDAEANWRLDRLINLFKNDKTNYDALIDGHIFSHVTTSPRYGITDKDGAVWVWAEQCLAPDQGELLKARWWRITSEHKVLPAPVALAGDYHGRLFADRNQRIYTSYSHGCARYEDGHWQPITDELQSRYSQILAEDRQGRIYLGSRSRKILAYHEKSPDVRTTLASHSFPTTRSPRAVCQDSQGRVWAQSSATPTVFSVFDKGKWRDIPFPINGEENDNVITLQPLRNGRVLALKSATGPAYLFDDKECVTYDNLRALVEEEFEMLCKSIDNRATAQNRYSKLCVDAKAERIWLAEWEDYAVFDGKRWIDVSAKINKRNALGNLDACLPIPGGSDMLMVANSGDTILQVGLKDDRVVKSRIALPGNRDVEINVASQTALWLDSRGHVLLSPDYPESLHYRHDGKRLKPVADSGTPRFEDSQGNLWFVQHTTDKLVVISPTGERGELKGGSFHATTHVVEQQPGVFWVNTRHGLLNVHLQDTEGQLTLKRVKEYTKGMPTLGCWGMYLDAHTQQIMFHTMDEPGSCQLWQIQLPPVTPTAPIPLPRPLPSSAP